MRAAVLISVLVSLSIILFLSPPSECKAVKEKTGKEKKETSKGKVSKDQGFETLSKQCSDPIDSFCKTSSQKKDDNHISLLVCMESNLGSLDAECQVAFFNYRFSLYTDRTVLQSLEDSCKDELGSLCAGKKGADQIECLFTVDPEKANLKEKCQSYTIQLGMVLFSDYKVLSDIHKVCDSDMDKGGCKVGLGRVGAFGSPVERIVQCLMHKAKSLSKKCAQKFQPANEDSKDNHMDPRIHEECKFDLKSLCSASDASSEGSSYKCLLSHISDISSPSCQDAVLEREGYSFVTLGVSLEFYQHCSGDMEKRSCSSSEQKESEGEFTRLTRVLMCLDKKGGKELGDSCAAEVDALKERFMGHYELSLEFAKACEIDREEYCSGSENLVDCLTKELQENRDKDSKECSKQLKLLSPGEGGPHQIPEDKEDNVQGKGGVAPANLQPQQLSDTKYAKQDLNQFCHKELDEFCSATERDHRSTLFCLTEHLSEHSMSTECHEHVGRIQFFLARPLPSHSSLLKGCDTELSQLCKLDKSGGDESDTALALACLFSHLTGEEGSDEAFSSNCQNAVNEFLRSVSNDNEMDEELFSACLPAMGELCPAPVDKSELSCLRENQERVDAGSLCFQMLERFNSVEEGMPSQNENVYMRCHLAIKMFCMNKPPHELVDCLKDSSSDPTFDNECKSALKNAKEIVTDANWKYDTHLNVNCKKDLVSDCPHANTNSEAIECLSLLYKAGTLSVKCKAYLENVIGDIQEKGVTNNEVPRADENAPFSNSQGSQLKDGCKKEIETLCSSSSPEQYLECLIDFKMDSQVSKVCQDTIISVEIDFVLRKHMESGVMSACEMEIKNYCLDASSTEQLRCLQGLSKTNGLGSDCVKEMEVMENNIHELQLDKSLAIKCHSKAYTLCHDNFPSSQSLVNCLSEHMKKLEFEKENKQCISEVVVLIGQAQLDIHKDPDLAEKCKSELRENCDKVRIGHTGHGEKIKCLFKLQEEDRKKMGSSCSKALRDRVELWSSLSKKYPNIQRGLEVILDNSIVILRKNVYPNIGRIFQTLFLFAVAVGCIVLCVLCRAAKRVRRKLL